LPYTELGKERAVGKIETGKVFEQPIEVIDKESAINNLTIICLICTYITMTLRF